MTDFFGLTLRKIIRSIVLLVFPWLPPYLFEKTDFYFHLMHNPDWYYNLSGIRLLVDLASFAVWGIVVAYLLRPRWAVVQIALNALLVWVLFYVACPVYGPGGVWQPECYYSGPDGLVGLRLAGIMFCYGALPVLLVFQTVLLIGVPQIATGILAARVGRSLKIGAASGPVSLLFISAFFWTPECPGCDRSLLYLLIPAWALFAL